MVEKSKIYVQYEPFLMLFIPFLIIVAKFVPKFSAWTSVKLCKLSKNEAEQLEEARQLRKEMNLISIMDEFAKHAKLQRKLNKIIGELESSGDCRKGQQSKIYKWTLGIASVLVGLAYLLVFFNYGTTTPVFVVPKFWFLPVQGLLSYPTGVEGAISIPIWTLLTRNVISVFVKV